MKRPQYNASMRCNGINYHIITDGEEARLIVFQKIEGIEHEVNIFEEILKFKDLLTYQELNAGGFAHFF
jgi:hypothetical protein